MVRQSDRDKKQVEKVSDGRRDVRQLRGQETKAKDPESERAGRADPHIPSCQKSHLSCEMVGSRAREATAWYGKIRTFPHEGTLRKSKGWAQLFRCSDRSEEWSSRHFWLS